MDTARKHTDTEYDNQLRTLRERLLLMAGRVEAMIADSVRALVERDIELARTTIEKDEEVNRDEVEIDELCVVVLARWQPMASDLRFIVLCFKMVTDLERIGDLAVNLSERVLDMDARSAPVSLDRLARMAHLVRAMVRDAVDAFVRGDAELAQQVILRDDEVDQLYHEVFREVLQVMRDDPAAVERGIHLQSVAKWLERIADHGTNLAEEVVFLVKGRDVRHPDKRKRERGSGGGWVSGSS